MKNAATMSSTAELEKPLSASPLLTSMAPVIMAVARPISATEGVGRGCRMSPRMVATKMPSMCMPRGSTPSGAGMKKITAPTRSMSPNFQSIETVSRLMVLDSWVEST